MYLLIIIFFKSEFMAAQRARPILLNERFLVINVSLVKPVSSLVPRPFSNFFHTHAQQRGRGERKGLVTRHPFRGSYKPRTWNVNNLICGYYSSVRARGRLLLWIIAERLSARLMIAHCVASVGSRDGYNYIIIYNYIYMSVTLLVPRRTPFLEAIHK